MVLKTLVLLKLFLIVRPTGTSPYEIHTPRLEEAVVSTGKRQVSACVLGQEPWSLQILSFPSAQSVFHLCVFTKSNLSNLHQVPLPHNPQSSLVIVNCCQPRPQLNKNLTAWYSLPGRITLGIVECWCLYACNLIISIHLSVI